MVNIEDMSIESVEKHLERMKEDKFPKIFKDSTYTLKIYGDGMLHIFLDCEDSLNMPFFDSLPLLKDAVDFAIKRKEGNEDD